MRIDAHLGFIALAAFCYADVMAQSSAPNSGAMELTQNYAIALAHAQERFAVAFDVVREFEGTAGPTATGGNWRSELINQLMHADQDTIARVRAAATLQAAMNLARASTVDAKSSAPGAKALGSTFTDFVFVPINPCRILDTRQNAVIPPRQTVSYSVTGSNPGGTSCLGAPVSPALFPAAAAINVTLDETGLTGFAVGSFLAIFPEGGTSTSSFMNFAPGQIIANAGVIGLNTANGEFSIRTNAQANVIVDLYGVFETPQATALKCVETAKNVANIDPNQSLTLTAPSCPTGYNATGGGCFGGGLFESRTIEEGTLNANDQWLCRFASFDPSSTFEVAATTHCCRVPGR